MMNLLGRRRRRLVWISVFFSMKKETKRKVKRAVGVTSAVVSTAFVGMMSLAKLKKVSLYMMMILKKKIL